ncbi:hypothetical protein [Faecalimicrobium sp. JNUCC 81]
MNLKKRASKGIALALVGITLGTPIFNIVLAMENNTTSISKDKDYEVSIQETNALTYESLNNDNIITDTTEISSNSNPRSRVRRSYPVDKFEGFKIVRGPKITSKPYKTSNQMEAAKVVLNSAFSSLVQGYLGYSVSAIQAVYYLTNQDIFKKIGGVYTKSYYVRKITNPKNAHVNVPVPYQYAYVTFVYRSSSMSDSTLEKIVWQHDGSPRLAKN